MPWTMNSEVGEEVLPITGGAVKDSDNADTVKTKVSKNTKADIGPYYV